MNDFFSKLENFFFDILGLILPGVIFLLILLSPVLFVDMTKVPDSIAGTSVILSALKMISNLLKDNWTVYPRSVLTIATILAYLMGHTVKVFSIIAYSFLTAIFDNSLNKWTLDAFNGIKDRLFSSKARLSKAYQWFKLIFKPFKTVMGDIFIFGTRNHNTSDEALARNCVDELDSRLSIKYPRDDYSVGKISGVITNQESLRTLGTFFLAKYNLYRSLSLIFLFTTLYYLYFFKAASLYIAPMSREISCIIFAAPVILWFTFHVKYKRYWGLYGQERIITLFYFLNKKKINEGG